MSSQNYKTTYSGSTTGAKTKQLYRFDAGDVFPGPKGEFDHDPGISETKDTAPEAGGKPTKDNTVDEIKAYLDANEVAYSADARKAELLKIAEQE